MLNSTMNNLIKVNPKSFILGAVFGGLAILMIAAESKRPVVWNYRVVQEKVPAYLYEKTVNDAATNGWELVSSQIILKETGTPSLSDGIIYMVLKQPKH